MKIEIMENFDELVFKRKVYISTIGWVSIIFSGLIIYFSFLGIINILLMLQSPILQNFSGSDGFNISKFFGKTYLVIFIGYSLSVIVGLLFFISSVGLIKAKNWGRKSFRGISLILIVLSVILIILFIVNSGGILSRLTGKKIFDTGFNGMTAFMKKMIAVKITAYGILLVILIRTLFQIVRRLSMAPYKSLFS